MTLCREYYWLKINRHCTLWPKIVMPMQLQKVLFSTKCRQCKQQLETLCKKYYLLKLYRHCSLRPKISMPIQLQQVLFSTELHLNFFCVGEILQKNMLATAQLALLTLASLGNVATFSSVSISHGIAQGTPGNAKVAMARIFFSKNFANVNKA